MTAEYPEHAKLKEINHFSEKIHEFLEWLSEQGVYLMRNDDADAVFAEKEEKLLARFFGIDLKKLEGEKIRMIEKQRECNRETR